MWYYYNNNIAYKLAFCCLYCPGQPILYFTCATSYNNVNIHVWYYYVQARTKRTATLNAWDLFRQARKQTDQF